MQFKCSRTHSYYKVICVMDVYQNNNINQPLKIFQFGVLSTSLGIDERNGIKCPRKNLWKIVVDISNNIVLTLLSIYDSKETAFLYFKLNRASSYFLPHFIFERIFLRFYVAPFVIYHGRLHRIRGCSRFQNYFRHPNLYGVLQKNTE